MRICFYVLSGILAILSRGLREDPIADGAFGKVDAPGQGSVPGRSVSPSAFRPLSLAFSLLFSGRLCYNDHRLARTITDLIVLAAKRLAKQKMIQ